jgi:hypothetical protein
MKKMVYIIFAMFIANIALAQTVEFQVDMSIKAKKGTFNPATDTVRVAGNFNSWSTTVDQLLDADNDSVYTLTKTLNVGDTLFFKFITAGAAITWEDDPNREYIVPTGSGVYFAYFNRDSIYVETKVIDITFTVDMEFEIVSGRFNPQQDTVSARGSFNGWSNTDILEVNPTNPNEYQVTISPSVGVGEILNYKYAYQGPRGTTWEGDPNKTYTITQQDYDLGVAFTSRVFNDLTLETVTNFEVDIKFVVDMNGAVSSLTGTAFPSIDNVVIAGANAPLQWPVGGWPNEDSIRVFFMYDDGTNGDSAAGDKIFTRILTFPQYSPFRIQYKYGANWGLASNTGGNDNENSVGNDHFITLSSQLVSGTVRNTFGVMGDHTLDQVVLDVKEIGNGVPESYTLDQNYPNPFNPTTNIRFSIPETGLVTLKVYNALGQEIATLLNEEKNAGSYEYNFNASDLTSGIYFYKIMSNNYTATKKMILIK